MRFQKILLVSLFLLSSIANAKFERADLSDVEGISTKLKSPETGFSQFVVGTDLVNVVAMAETKTMEDPQLVIVQYSTKNDKLTLVQTKYFHGAWDGHGTSEYVFKNRVAISPDGRKLAFKKIVQFGECITTVDLVNLQEDGCLTRSRYDVEMAFDPKNEYLAIWNYAVSHDRYELVIWDLQTRKYKTFFSFVDNGHNSWTRLQAIDMEKKQVYFLENVSDGSVVATVRDADSGKLIFKTGAVVSNSGMVSTSGSRWPLAMSTQNQLVAYGKHLKQLDKWEIKLWDLHSNQEKPLKKTVVTEFAPDLIAYPWIIGSVGRMSSSQSDFFNLETGKRQIIEANGRIQSLPDFDQKHEKFILLSYHSGNDTSQPQIPGRAYLELWTVRK